MVAGSRLGSARGHGARASTLPRPWSPLASLAGSRVASYLVPLTLYLIAAVFLLTPWLFAAHPDWAYNWEDYAAWRLTAFWESPLGPARDVWAPTDGLMTDSGQGPLVGFPAALGIAVGGVSLEAMRTPVSLLAAAAVPLLWFLGRMAVGTGVASLAALLLAISPAYVFYGRTATLVGISLVPLLLTAIALVRVLDAEDSGWRWARDGTLAGALLLGIFAYAPVRLLWPITVAMLGLAALRDPRRRATLGRTAVLCLLIVPAGTMLAEQLAAPAPDPAAAALGYFHARGEQLVAMRIDPELAADYLREPIAAPEAGWQHARRLVTQNVADLGRLVLDWQTTPIPTDYWNASGRFWPWLLLPWAVLGAVSVYREVARGGRVALLVPLGLAAGLALPLLLTSRVHVGRLLPALPFALLLAAAGVGLVAARLARWCRMAGADTAAHWVAPWLAAMLMLPAAAMARADLATPVPPSRAALTAAAMASWQPEVAKRGSAVLLEDPALGDDIEQVHAAAYRLALDRHYRFVDLQQPHIAVPDQRPALLWHGALGALASGALAQPCTRLWFVAPEVTDAFLAAWRAAGCRGAPDSVILP